MKNTMKHIAPKPAKAMPAKEMPKKHHGKNLGTWLHPAKKKK